ncbi:MAG TPA: hypothetical protein VNZ58_11945 [Thermomicrobiales bacterium]|nr:hypothetical protein [Thermomicrobiales bacterium]
MSSAEKREKKPAPGFRKEDRHEFRYQLSIALAGAFSWFFFLIPPPFRNGFAEMCGSLFFRVSHGYRESVLRNVMQVLGKDEEDGEARAVAKSIFRNSALNFMDLLILPRRSSRSLLRTTYVVQGNWSLVDDAIKSGRGLIFLTGHVGCFDFIGQSLAARGLKLTIVTGRTTSRFIFDGVTWLRGARGANLVEPTPSGVRNVIRALRRGECAVFLADRDFFQNGYEVEFFGRMTTLPPGVVRIARDTGAFVLPMFTRRVRGGHEIRLYPPLEIGKTSDTQADVHRGLEIVVPYLEQGISSSIEQWAMFQDVWPEKPPATVKIFPTGSPLESELLEKVAAHLPEIKTGDGADGTSTR